MSIFKAKEKAKIILLTSLLIVSMLSTSFTVLANNLIKPMNEVEWPKIMVSLGDSYSSGEGIPPFYGQEAPISNKINNDDWLAHRSKKSWPGQLKLPTNAGTMADNMGTYWFFGAISGATTEHMENSFNKEYNRLNHKGSKNVDAELNIFDELDGREADYVTLTLGGNDAQFAEVITSAVMDVNSYLQFGHLEDKLNSVWNDFYRNGGIRDNLRKAYQKIDERAGEKEKIIVAGYPQLVAEVDNGLFSLEEAKLINESVSQFNKEIKNIVSSCKASGMKICFVSVEEGFKGHEAYSSDPYINPVMFGAQPEDLKEILISSSYSIHPNEKGAEVYRACVQKKIDELEKDDGQSEWPTKTTSDERDIVLVLDVSGSMAGTPLEETKKASSKFISTILKEDASIGIVTYDNSASMVSNFSIDEQTLNVIANEITDGGGTNIESGLAKAQEMLSTSNAKKKIIVLMSDGEPNDGKVGDELVSYADAIKDDGTYIYTLGFFESMGSSKSSAQLLMEQIASEGCHYEVSNADDLVFFFGDVADQINGQKYIYVRIACPVDVTVEHDGEKLCSIKDDENARTSFGSLTFEESTETYEDSSDDRVKILRLKDDFNYDIQIEGNGRGSMDYTIGFMDENGEYSDLREFKNVKITKRTEIDTVAGNTSSTMLKVDSDGDGKYDLKYKAKANSVGEIVDYSYILYIALGILILISVLVIYIKIKRWKKQRIINENKKKAMKKKFCVHCGNEMSGDKAYCEKCGSKMN